MTVVKFPTEKSPMGFLLYLLFIKIFQEWLAKLIFGTETTSEILNNISREQFLAWRLRDHFTLTKLIFGTDIKNEVINNILLKIFNEVWNIYIKT